MAIIMVIGLLTMKPIVQDLSYHSFADKRSILGIQNFWNVISNLPFLLVGLLGFVNLLKKKGGNLQLKVFYIGVALVAFGSGYYHYAPNNETLVWDRLPMTIAFMGLFSFVISDYLNEKIGKTLLVPLLVFGLISIVYWEIYDDLRLYVFVQFYPILMIPIVLIFFKKEHHKNNAFWLLLICYIVAKLVEYYDEESYKMFDFISGHSLKHLSASLGVYLFYRTYK